MTAHNIILLLIKVKGLPDGASATALPPDVYCKKNNFL